MRRTVLAVVVCSEIFYYMKNPVVITRKFCQAAKFERIHVELSER